MKIDLFTFIAQIVNFVILIVLLYFVLFKRIVRAIDERESAMEEDLKRLEADQKSAQEMIGEYEELLSEFESEKQAMFDEAKQEVKEEKDRRYEEAQREIEEKKAQWNRRIEDEKSEFLSRLQKVIGLEVYETAENVLQDLAGQDLQSSIWRRWINTLKNLSKGETDLFCDRYAKRKKEEIRIVSSFALQEKERGEIEKELSRILQQKLQLTFCEDPASLGICLEIDGYELNWTSKRYLKKLRDRFEQIV